MYEAFISFKNLDSNGRQTKDSEIAYQLYNMLRSLGVTTFFSNAEIQRKADPRWASVIDSALEEAKVIIVIGTRLEYVKSKWVEYEWRYFSSQINSGADKAMLSVMEGFQLSKLPPAFAQVQNYSPKNIGLAADMVCGILGKERPDQRAAREKAEREEAERRAREEAARRQAEQEAARRKAEQEAARKRAEEEAARRKAEREAAKELKRKQTAELKAQRRASGTNRKPIGIIVTAAALVAAIVCGVIWLPGIVKSDGDSQQVESNVSENKNIPYLSDLTDVSVGDHVYFGNYPQTEDGEELPIEWRVLDIQDGKALMISEYLLDAHRYDDDSNNWKYSKLREWLNNGFKKRAFVADEQQKLSEIDGDKVSLLADFQVVRFINSIDDRKAKPTAYAIKRGAYVSPTNGTGWWWLLSPGQYSNYAAYVKTNGNIDKYGDVGKDYGSVRPVVLVSL